MDEENRTEETFINALAVFMKTGPSESKLTKWLKKYSREYMLHNPITSVDLALLILNLNNTLVETRKQKGIKYE